MFISSTQNSILNVQGPNNKVELRQTGPRQMHRFHIHIVFFFSFSFSSDTTFPHNGNLHTKDNFTNGLKLRTKHTVKYIHERTKNTHHGARNRGKNRAKLPVAFVYWFRRSENVWVKRPMLQKCITYSFRLQREKRNCVGRNGPRHCGIIFPDNRVVSIVDGVILTMVRGERTAKCRIGRIRSNNHKCCSNIS